VGGFASQPKSNLISLKGNYDGVSMNEPAPSIGPATLLAFVFIVLISEPTFGQVGTGTLRVDIANGFDSSECGSENAPCKNIQQAVNLATHDDELLIASGTYTFEPQLEQCSTGNTAVICLVDKRLTLRGGYSSSNWTIADPVANLTIIDGENTNRGVFVEELLSGSASLVMSGITVTRCLGPPRDGQVDAFGGGLSAVAPDPQKLVIVLEDMVFSDNQVAGGDVTAGAGGFGAGGAVSLRNAEPPSRLIDIIFNNNQALGGSGPERGGLAVGGALYSYHSNVTATHLTFDNNSAMAGSSNGSGLSGGLLADALGGAVALMSGSYFDLDRITATANTATGGNAGTDAGGAFGGALYAEGKDASHRVTLHLSNSALSHNKSIGGSGENGGLGTGAGLMHTKYVDMVLDRVEIVGNTSYGGNGTVNRGGGGGGGVKSTGGPVEGSSNAIFSNCIFADNAIIFGSGGGSRGGGGGGLFVQNLATAEVIHCTFSRNSLSAQPLTGLAITLAGGTGPVTLTIKYSIIADHTQSSDLQAVFVADGNTAVFDTGLLAGNVTDTGGAGSVVGLDSMLFASTADFVSPGAPDFDYHLGDTSVAIDHAAESSTPDDIDGDLRDQAPDIGADEYWFISENLFLDGFESGDLRAWSQTTP